MSLLREIVRLRDESARPRTPTSSGYQGAVSVLFADVHQKQHGQTAHRAGAQGRGQPKDLTAVQSYGRGPPSNKRAPVTKSSASLSSSSSRSRSARTRDGTGSNVPGDHPVAADATARPNRGQRCGLEERLQSRYLRFPFVVVSERRPVSSSRG